MGARSACRRLSRAEYEVLDNIWRRAARHPGGALFASRRPRRPIPAELATRRLYVDAGAARTLAVLAAAGCLEVAGEAGAVTLYVPRSNPYTGGCS